MKELKALQVMKTFQLERNIILIDEISFSTDGGVALILESHGKLSIISKSSLEIVQSHFLHFLPYNKIESPEESKESFSCALVLSQQGLTAPTYNIVACTTTGHVGSWNCLTGELLHHISTPCDYIQSIHPANLPSIPPSTYQFSSQPLNSVIVVGTNGNISICAVNSMNEVRRISCSPIVASIIFSSLSDTPCYGKLKEAENNAQRKDLLFVITANGRLIIFDMLQGKAISELLLSGREGFSLALCQIAWTESIKKFLWGCMCSRGGDATLKTLSGREKAISTPFSPLTLHNSLIPKGEDNSLEGYLTGVRETIPSELCIAIGRLDGGISFIHAQTGVVLEDSIHLFNRAISKVYFLPASTRAHSGLPLLWDVEKQRQLKAEQESKKKPSKTAGAKGKAKKEETVVRPLPLSTQLSVKLQNFLQPLRMIIVSQTGSVRVLDTSAITPVSTFLEGLDDNPTNHQSIYPIKRMIWQIGASSVKEMSYEEFDNSLYERNQFQIVDSQNKEVELKERLKQQNLKKKKGKQSSPKTKKKN